MRNSFAYAVILFSLSVTIAPVASAQNVASAQAVAENPDEPNAANDDLVRQLESNAARGGEFLPKAVQALARLGAWESVDRWLPTFNQIDDQQQLARAATTIGPNVLLRISVRGELSPESQEALAKLSAAAKQYRQSDGRLTQAIADLDLENHDRLLAANRILMQGGEATIKLGVEAIVAGVSPKQQTRLLAILKKLGDGGRQALNQFALYGGDNAQLRAIVALVESDLKSSIDPLVTAAFGATAGEQAKSYSLERMQSVSAKMDRISAESYLSDRLSTLRELAQRTFNTAETTNIWTVDLKTNELSHVRSKAIFLAYRDAYDAAQRLLQLESLAYQSKSSALIATLNYMLMIDVDWGTDTQIAAFEGSVGKRATEADLIAALKESRVSRDPAASVGALRVLSHRLSNAADAAAISNTLLSPVVSDGMPVLVDATRDPEPWVRYEAALLVADIVSASGKKTQFAGQSLVVKTLAEISRLADRPTAILIETRPFIALQQQSILGKLGMRVRHVQSAMSAEAEIARGGEIRMVLSKIQLPDMSTSEFVDRVRRQPHGLNVPVVLYWDEEASEKTRQAAKWLTTSDRWRDDSVPAVRLVPLPGDTSALADVLQEVSNKQRLPQFTSTDRRSFRMAAIDALAVFGIGQ